MSVSRHRTASAALVLLAWIGTAPSAAAAEPIVVLQPLIEPLLSEATRASALQALDEALRREGEGPTHSTEPRPCEQPGCEQASQGGAHAAAGGQRTVQLTIWRSTTSPDGVAGGVSVAIVSSDGLRYSEGSIINGKHDAAIIDAIGAATHGAYERLRRGPGPWLEVRGAPTGSAVTIDNRRVGVVPGRYRVAGGLHHVVVTAPGFATFDATVTVPRNLDAWKQLDIELHPDRASIANELDGESSARPSPINYVIAGCALTLGAVIAISPIRTMLEDGECGRVDSGRCTGVVEMDTGSSAQLGAAVLLVGGSAVFAIWAPLRVRVYSESAQAELALRF
jgi:hypothetical protein